MKKTQENAKSAKTLTEIGKYNMKVRDALSKSPMNPLTKHALAIFKTNSQRNKLSSIAYNKAVEVFNTTHGLLLLKKGEEHGQENAKNAKTYNYINFPYLNKESMKSAMDNYRQFVYTYNRQATKENKAIKRYNKTVVLPKSIALDTLWKIEAVKNNNQGLFTKAYNQSIEDLNTHLQIAYLPKKCIQTIKYSSEIVFNVLVGFYISQLKTRNEYLKAAKRPLRVLKSELPKLKIDHRKLATHTIAGIPRLAFCKKTAQNHIKRLRESGILINYTYINQNKPISVNFNPEIVAILDGNTPKNKLTNNQSVNTSSGKKLPHNKDITRTFIKEKEIKDCENFTVGNKCGSTPKQYVSAAQGYQSTTWIGNEKKILPRENKATILKLLPDFLKTTPKLQGTNSTLTRNFLAKLLDEKEFAQQLSKHEYDNYKGLSNHYLRKVSQYANLTQEEFKAVLVQDFIKSSAKIWRNHQNVAQGSWKNAINQLNDILFQGITTKESLIEKIKEYRWKLEFARKWFLKTNVNALYPSLYFDVHRKSASGIGFFGLHPIWNTHLKYQQKKKETLQKSKTQENARKRKDKEKQRFNNAIQAYKKGKYSAKQLYNYVQDHLPHYFIPLLITALEKEKQYYKNAYK